MANPSLHIRLAVPTDAELIADFNAALALETESVTLDMELLRPGVEALLADPFKGRYFVGLDGERIVGQLMHTWEWSDWRNGMFWWLQSVYVLPEYRRSGVFKRLYQHLETLAKAEPGVCGLRLYVDKENARAQRTYLNQGMRQTDYLIMEDDYRQAPTEKTHA